jgi:subtilase family serine protease
VIIDWCGSTTIRNDANAFSRQFGLPLLNFTTFHVIETPRASQCMAADQTEINIDVEWAHAIAPSANIDLVVPPSATFQDVDQAEFYAVNYSLGNSLSGSYDSPESLTPPSVLATENLISEIAAISGISTNFSSGDNGDFTANGLSPTVSAPADSPWATSVGGVSLALSSANSIAWQSGWGNNEILLTQTGQIYDPPSSLGFAGGAGGGPSNCVVHDGGGNCLAGFPKPSFQRALPGKYRQVPDVAWLADPFTGVVIAISVPGQVPGLVWQVWGGTSVACPMFSALWAIANQEAGAPLGQAAQYLYSLPRGAIIDVVPLSTRTNVKASIQVLGGIHNYNARQVLGGSAPVNFISALWDYPWEGDTALAISFGTDCTAVPNTFGGATLCDSSSALRTEVGWDNVTGVGTPNGKVFGDSFKPPAAGNHP